MTPTPPLSGKLRPTSVRVLGEGERSRRVPDDSAFTSAGVRRVPLDDDPDAGDKDIDDDVDSAASVTVDCSAVRLANFVYECYPGSCPVAAPQWLLAAILRPYMPCPTPRSPPICILRFTQGCPTSWWMLVIGLPLWRGVSSPCRPLSLRRSVSMLWPMLNIFPRPNC